MHRFEAFAQRFLADADALRLTQLMDGLRDEDLVAVLAGSNARSDPERYVRNVLTTELMNRMHGKQALLSQLALPRVTTALDDVSEAVRRALRADMSCIDEVDGDEFVLHGRNRLPGELATTERCRQSSMALCQRVLETRAPVVIDDIPNDPSSREVPAWTKFQIRSYAAAPGFDDAGDVACVVWVAGYAGRGFDADEVLTLARVAGRVSLELRA